MPRHAAVPQGSLGDLNSPFSAVRSAPNVSLKPASGPVHEEIHAHATRVLANAHRLLAQTDTHRCALQRCLDLLQTADPEAYFYYSLDPATITLAPGLHPRTRKARRLRPLLTTALRQVEARLDAIRLTTLLTISRLGIPVALGHFLIPGPLPHTLAALMPRAAPSASPLVSSAPQETTQQRSRLRRGPHHHKLP
jgi:hypothetical protein